MAAAHCAISASSSPMTSPSGATPSASSRYLPTCSPTPSNTRRPARPSRSPATSCPPPPHPPSSAAAPPPPRTSWPRSASATTARASLPIRRRCSSTASSASRATSPPASSVPASASISAASSLRPWAAPSPSRAPASPAKAPRSLCACPPPPHPHPPRPPQPSPLSFPLPCPCLARRFQTVARQPPVGDEPDHRHTGIGEVRQNGAERKRLAEARQHHAQSVDDDRDLALEIAADRLLDIGPLIGTDNDSGQDVVGDARQQADQAIDHGGPRCQRMIARPGCAHRHEREPEEQVKIRPHHVAVDGARRAQQVMVIVPVDTDDGEAQHVYQELRCQRRERFDIRALRRPELQHHDGDDNRQHAVAEGLQASGADEIGCLWRTIVVFHARI